MATGFPVKANYATGDVLTAANMNDLSGTLNYLQYMPPRNSVLNSNFSCWQRGTSMSANYVYTADRWMAGRNGGVAGLTVSRQATSDTTNLPFIQYCARVQRDSGNTNTATLTIGQPFETVNSIRFAGQSVTLSFYARAGANYSATSSALNVKLDTGTGTDQNGLTGAYTGGASPINGTATLTTTWQRFTFNATLAATTTELMIYFNATPVGTAGANDYFEITGVQLELGSVANTYMPNQPTYQGELAACQRYYWRNSGAQLYSSYGAGYGATTTVSQYIINNPVTMRVAPTSVDYSNLGASVYGSGPVAITSLSLSANETNQNAITVWGTSASGITVAKPYFIANANTTSGYIGASAEL